MDEQHRVYLVGGNDEETAVFTLFDEGDHCRLQCEYRDKAVESTAPDFFQALCDVRGLLAKDGLIPFCYGASLNVYPSGMARDMGQGLKAYKMAIGRHARREDLVYIFAQGANVVPASVAAQEQFWRDWLASPRTSVPFPQWVKSGEVQTEQCSPVCASKQTQAVCEYTP